MKKLYRNEQWYKFSKEVQHRDKKKCTKCGRTHLNVILQTHHKFYKPGYKPWEYELSDCVTLCKGCHAREHKIIEPNEDWTLISIDDLGGLTGTCERIGCGHEIRYEHNIYHPNWGHKIVGSTCVDYLTVKDQSISKDILKIHQKITKFINVSEWLNDVTQNEKKFIYTTHQHHHIRIYGNKKNFSYQILIKHKGIKFYDCKCTVRVNNKTLDQVKELGYIDLKGSTSEIDDEKQMLRNLYKNIF